MDLNLELKHKLVQQALEERLPPVDVLPATEVDALETAVVKGSARRTAKDSSAAPGAAAGEAYASSRTQWHVASISHNILNVRACWPLAATLASCVL